MISKLKPKSEFNRNVLTLLTGTTIAQAIPIAISPVLTRIYTPEDFGIVALFIAIATIFGTIANARYELAIMLPKKDEDAINIFALGFIINFFISMGLFLLVLLFNDYFISLLGNEEIGSWLYFIPFAVFFIGFFNILNYFNNRKKNYNDLRNATIVRSIVLAIVQISIGFLKQGVTGLISGEILSRMFANYKLSKNIFKDKVLISRISKVKMIALAKKYLDFPKHNMPSSLADMVTLQLPFLFIIKIFGTAINGFYFFAAKIIALPSALLGKSIAQVFFQKMVSYKNENKRCMPLFLNTLKKLSIISFPIAVGIFLFSPIVFEIVFGENWRMSGEIAQYLAVVFFIRFVSSTVSPVFSISGFVKRGAVWKYTYFLSSLSLFSLALVLKIEFYDFLLLYVIHEVLLYSTYLFLMIKSVKELDLQIKKDL